MIDSTGPKISSWAIVMSRRDVGEHRRLHEVARVEALGRLGATGDERGALVDALLDVAAHPVALRVAETSGPSCASLANGSPTVNALGRVLAGDALVLGERRAARACAVSAEQVWPEFR